MGLSLTLVLSNPKSLSAAVEFDDTDDYFTGTDADVSTQISMSAWVRWDGTTPNGDQIIQKRKETATQNAQYGLFVGDDTATGQPGFYYADSTGSFEVFYTTSGHLADGNWHHLGLVYTYGTGSSADFYVDGVDVADGWRSGNDGNATVPSNDEVYAVGALDNDAEHFDGAIGEIALWDVILSAKEMAQLANGGKRMPLQIQKANLILYLPMDDGTVGTSADGDTLYDLSGNGHDATGVDGANNTGLTWSAEEVLSYP